jgi:hypothetical protein
MAIPMKVPYEGDCNQVQATLRKLEPEVVMALR